jgi:hypothetical protein
MEVKTFHCERCRELFVKEEPDKAELAEARQYFGEVAPEDQAMVCADCYRVFMEWFREHGVN